MAFNAEISEMMKIRLSTMSTDLINLVVSDAEAAHESLVDFGALGENDELSHIGHSRGLLVESHGNIH